MTTDTPKPALPEPKTLGWNPDAAWHHREIKGYTADQLHEYAQQCVEAAVAEARAVPNGLARGLLWLAYVWNDHNFEPAHKEAQRIAANAGINSFEEANAWLATLSPPQPAQVVMTDERINTLADQFLSVRFDEHEEPQVDGERKFARAVIAEYERLSGITPAQGAEPSTSTRVEG